MTRMIAIAGFFFFAARGQMSVIASLIVLNLELATAQQKLGCIHVQMSAGLTMFIKICRSFLH
jgi:hypothetical protein